jgi:hypothetical protein
MSVSRSLLEPRSSAGISHMTKFVGLASFVEVPVLISGIQRMVPY